MPLIHIHLVVGRTEQQKRALLHAVGEAVQHTIGAPRDTIRVWITEFPGTDFLVGGETFADRAARTERDVSADPLASEGMPAPR